MQAKFVHTNLIARDWKKLAEFYITVFGCKPKPPERDLSGDWLDQLTALESAHLWGVHLLLPGFEVGAPTLEIFQYGENVPNPEKKINKEGYGHIAFAVEDVELCLQRIIEHGGSAVGQVAKGEVKGVGNIHVVYARDPEGNILEIQKWG